MVSLINHVTQVHGTGSEVGRGAVLIRLGAMGVDRALFRTACECFFPHCSR